MRGVGIADNFPAYRLPRLPERGAAANAWRRRAQTYPLVDRGGAVFAADRRLLHRLFVPP